MRIVSIIIGVFVLFSCSKKVVGVRDFCESEFVNQKAPSKLNLTGGIAFKNHTGELLTDSSKCLPNLVDFLKIRSIKRIDLVVYHTFGSERFYKEGLLESGNLKDYLVASGIDSSKIFFDTSLDRKNSFQYESIYRKVEVLLEY